MMKLGTNIKRNSVILVVGMLFSVSALFFSTATPAFAGTKSVGGGSSETAGSTICDSIGGCDNNPNSSTSLDGAMSFVVNLLSIILGIAAVIMIIIGGLKYTTSNGDSGAITSAKHTIIYAIVGLVVAVLARPIVGLVLGSFGK